MRRRSRKSLERDSKLLAEAVPIMKAALAEITELRAEVDFQTAAANRLAGERADALLKVKVIFGENEKVREVLTALQMQSFDQAERIAQLEQELYDDEALLDAYERYGHVEDDEFPDPTEQPLSATQEYFGRTWIYKHDPTEEPFA